MSATISRWIRWPGILAWVFLALLPLAVLTVRGGNWKQGLALYALCCLLSLLVLALFAVLSLVPRFASQRGLILRRALPALPGSILLVAAIVGGRGIPPIHDITTDVADPPRFEAVVELRAADDNSLEIDPAVIAEQQNAYPDLDTLQTSRNYGETYAAALETARDLGWEIVRDDVNAGFIEAVDTTAIMGFRDDVVIRVRTTDAGTLVDLRSASRVGVSDVGANAKRIRAFAERFREAVGA